MNQTMTPYHIVDLSRARQVMRSMLDVSGPQHYMYGLLEVDVTVAKRFIEQNRARTGELLSFTGFLAFCLARAISEDKTVQACIKGRKQLIVFDAVDVGLMVERNTEGKRRLMGYVIRGADGKTYRQIHEEIRRVQSEPAPQGRGLPSWFVTALLLPWPLSSLVKALLRLATSMAPERFTSMGGTVGITAVGMFGKGQAGWGIYPLPQGLGLVVGSTAWKPAVVDGRIEPRQILNLTVMFDHTVIDGAPAARFTRRLLELIESGCGLEDDQAADPHHSPPAGL